MRKKETQKRFHLRKFLYSFVVLALVSTFAGCGGTSSGTTQQSIPGTSTVAFSIPLHQPGSQFAAGPALRSGVNTALARPEFIDPAANGSISGYFDGQLVMTLNLGLINWTGSFPVIPSGDLTGTAGTSDGSTISWTSTLTGSTLSVAATVNTLVNGNSHTFGVVQTNGACLFVDGSPCIDGNAGYVLAEGQTSFTASDSNITLTLGGVLQSGYLCNPNDTTGCSTFPGPTGMDGLYHYMAFPTDENGNPVIANVAPPTGVPMTPYDNGAWQIVVSDSTVVNVTPEHLEYSKTAADANPLNILGPFTLPNPFPLSMWWDGEGFSVQCLKAGTSIISMQMMPGTGSKSAGTVNGFTYSSQNYPAAGAVLGNIGASTYFGNGEGVLFTCSMGSTHIIIN